VRHSERSTASLRAALDLALISFACLYFEMIVVRWLASDVRVFAYLKNLPLLAAFLGLGLGCIRAGGRLFGLFPLFCLLFAALVAFAGPLGLVHLYFPQEGFWAWNDANFQEQGWPPALLTARFFVVVLALFFLVVALFTALGERLGTQFDALPPNRAYTVNLLASLLGIWAFAALSWLGWPPAGWFAVGFLVLLRFVLRPEPPAPATADEQAQPLPRRRWRGPGRAGRHWRRGLPALGVLAVTLGVVALAPGATRWSPYYRIDLSPYDVPNAAGGHDPAGYKLTVNHDYHQNALDLGDAFVRAHPGPALETPRQAYDLPYAFAQPRRVLVVGAGMGNDVAAALRHGAQQIDAVEIDPAILALGSELHPESPYRSPRVRLVTEDARAFLARTDAQYDLIVFGLLDSHTLLSSMSSLRLDSYVYTQESLAQARTRLAPGGHLALSFAASLGEWGWLAARLYQMVAEAFGEEPLALDLGYDASTLYLVGPGLAERLAADPSLAARAVDPVPLREPVPPATDDWPFLYLREHGVPLIPYGVVLVLLLLGGGALVGLALRGEAGRGLAANGEGAPTAPARSGAPSAAAPPEPGALLFPTALDLPMFLLGAAFMLVEVKSISQVSLLLGSTWQVTALIVSAILLLALLANLLVAWWRPTHVGPAYALLALALVADYFQPLRALGGQDALVRAGLGSLLPVLPLLFAGVVFATLFARAPAPRRAFGFNLLGALAGGLLEYASMAVGFKALGLLALVCYLGSWAALRRVPWLAPVRRARHHAAPRPAGLPGAPPRPRRRVPARGRTRVVLAPHEEIDGGA
jgi:SAM-dependent methyltransferase